jgi:predicted AAA+ superfamily ATPase
VIKRPVYTRIWEELAAEKAMIFITGPRQAGKTTFAQSAAANYTNRAYFNWDVITDRTMLIHEPYFFERIERIDASPPLVIFDEIHKYKDWKNYLKGAYDRFHEEYRFLVTGSGRLDLYQKGGDSLAGRYVLFHLWPLTLAELANRPVTLDTFRTDPLGVVSDPDQAFEAAWRRLFAFGGFPEPYVRARAASYRRWSTAYHKQLIREDLRDLTGIQSIGEVETLFALLPERVGSLLSITSLSEALRTSYNTVKHWMETLERFYLTFSIPPWTRSITRATQKARKTYLFDYAMIDPPSARFENMVAFELFRAVNGWNDLGHGSFGLYFARNKEKEEVDFVLTEKRRPFLLVEAKMSENDPAAALKKFQRQLNVPAVQLTNQGTGFRKTTNGNQSILVTPAHLWLPRLP